MKKIILTSLVILGMTVTSVSAYDLKTNMQLLGAEMAVLQHGFMYSDMKGVRDAVEELSKHSNELLGNKEKFKEMLPKSKKHKANELLKITSTYNCFIIVFTMFLMQFKEIRFSKYRSYSFF